VRQEEAARFVLDREAIRRNARLLEIRPPEGMAPIPAPDEADAGPVYPEDALARLPSMLRENGRLAIATWAHLATAHDWTFLPDSVYRAVGRAVLPGRFQHVFDAGDWLLLDAAHNPQALAALGESMAERGIAPRAVVFACLADKDLPAMAGVLARTVAAPVHVPELPNVERAVPAADICAALGAAGLQAVPQTDTAAALAAAFAEPSPEGDSERQPVLVCGSLYLLAAFFTLRPYLLESMHCGER
jgi:dihydrofolate synthase/folylpolyglutamate synthase